MANRERHYRYAISYLVIALIAAIGFGLFDVPSLVDKTSFALTITSLVLGVVAIIYTFVSASKQDVQLSQLLETNLKISNASTDIQAAALTITEQVGVIPNRLDVLDVKLDSVLSNPNPPPQGDAIPEYTLQDLRRFISELPVAGIASLYLFHRAKEANVTIDDDLTKKISSVPFHFVFGVLTGAEAAGILKLSYTKGKITPESSAPVFEEHIANEMQRVLEILGPERNESLQMLILAIDREIP
jgi:hypothetical protein